MVFLEYFAGTLLGFFLLNRLLSLVVFEFRVSLRSICNEGRETEVPRFHGELDTSHVGAIPLEVRNFFSFLCLITTQQKRNLRGKFFSETLC